MGAGVIPIDRLTDVTAPVATVGARISRHQLHARLRLRFPRPPPHEPPAQPPTPAEILRALAVARGWLNGSGMPDATRAARLVLKEYAAGGLVYCVWPPGEARQCELDDGLGTWTGQPELLKYATSAAP